MKEFSNYDTRNYTTVPVKDGYREWSKSYDSSEVPLWMTTHLLSKIDFLNWHEQQKVVELACGTGRFGEWLKSLGVQDLTGVDITPEMLSKAKDRSCYANLVQEDIRKTSLGAGDFNVVLNVLSDEHLPDLKPLYMEAMRLSSDDGWFINLGYHPYFLFSGIPTHFDDESGQSIAIENYIHSFSDHVKAAKSCGFHLKTLEEEFVDEKWVNRFPSWEKHKGKPISYMMVWQKEQSND